MTYKNASFTAKRTGFVIAIDGPTAAGKGTVAPLLAEKLGGFYLYTGAMYRCVALYCIENGISPKDTDLILLSLKKISIDLFDNRVLLNGQDVTERIQQENTAMVSSTISIIPDVRVEMVKRQQEIAQRYIEKGIVVVAEGRDTATRIFPDARLKVFLTASLQVRAKRRLAQIRKRGNKATTFEEVVRDIDLRDKQDSTRKTDPLVKNPKELGYFVLDSSELSQDQTIAAISSKIQRLF